MARCRCSTIVFGNTVQFGYEKCEGLVGQSCFGKSPGDGDFS